MGEVYRFVCNPQNHRLAICRYRTRTANESIPRRERAQQQLASMPSSIKIVPKNIAKPSLLRFFKTLKKFAKPKKKKLTSNDLVFIILVFLSFLFFNQIIWVFSLNYLAFSLLRYCLSFLFILSPPPTLHAFHTPSQIK